MIGGALGIVLSIAAVELQPGASWNESRRYRDALSGLEVTQLTTRGVYNQGPTVHYGSAFTRDGKVVFATIRDGYSALLSGDVRTGELTMQHRGPALPPETVTLPLKELMARTFPRIEGINVAASPRHHFAAVITRRDNTLQLVDLEKHRTQLLISGAGDPDRWMTTPVFSWDGTSVAFPAGSKSHAPRDRSRNPIVYWASDFAGNLQKLHAEEWGQTHIFANPAEANCWIIKKGRPAFTWPREDQAAREKVLRQPSCFLLDSSSGKLTPLLPRNAHKDITHLAWNGRGDRIVYHGSAAGGGVFVGAMDRQGKVLWEYVDPEWNHRRNGLSHIAADSVGDFIFDDGMLVPGQLSLLDFRHAGSDGKPAIYPVAAWKNDWNGAPGQNAHPHPAVSPDGRTLVFYGCRDGAIHVYAVDISTLRQRLMSLPAREGRGK